MVSSADDETIQPVCTHCWFTWYFTKMIIHSEIQVPPAISAIHLEHLYQQKTKKKNWETLVMSIDNRWCCYKLVK